MAFVESVKGYVDKGISVSKNVFSKAGDAASRLGDQGVKKVEVMQLSAALKEQFAALGEAVYQELSGSPDKTVDASSPSAAPFIARITELKASIAEREEALKKMQKKSEKK